MTLTEVFFLVAVASALILMAATLTAIAKPEDRRSMGVRLSDDDFTWKDDR